MDLVQSEYGWSDEYVLSLSVVRLRQVVEAIGVRRRDLSRERWAQVVWETRTLARFIAATVEDKIDMAKTGGVNPLAEQARDLGKEFLFEDENPEPAPAPVDESGEPLDNPEDTAVSVGQAGPESEAERVARLADKNPMGAVRLFAGKLEEGR
jgi:hypothetical protein